MANALEAKSVHKIYGKGQNSYEALRGVDLKIAQGESVAIIGKSGSGKSTLMHILAGLDRPTSGEVLASGKDIASLNEKGISEFRNQNVGFIFQQFFLQPNLTVLENVMVPLKISGISRPKRRQMALEALSQVGMTDKAANLATNLSGGQKQRVAIARAIAVKPRIIFADEPTGNLDTETGQQVIETLFSLQKEQGITLVVVTHDTDLAKLCRRQITIKDGAIA